MSETIEQVCGEPQSELCMFSATQLAAMIRDRQVSPVEVVLACLERIEVVQATLNPFCFTYPEESLALARKAEQSVMANEQVGPLHGVPIAIKDFTPTAGKRTTRGSVAFEHWVPDFDPVIVQRLSHAGAIMVGKTTTPEFAYSSFTRSPLWGDTCNPWDARCSSGGSSGGSGVAVATGCVALAEGTDMGGSVRIPAALCGVVGLKPSIGRIPMDILPSVFDSISHFGPLARTVDDARLFLSVTEGAHDADIQSQVAPIPLPPEFDLDLRGLSIAVSEDLGYFHVHLDVRKNFQKTVTLLEQAGANVVPVSLPWTHELSDAWLKMWEVMLAACFSDCLHEHADRMDPAVVALIEAGLRCDAVSYKRLENVRTRQWQQLAKVFADHDALLCPTMAQVAPRNDCADADFEVVDENGRLHGLDMTGIFNNVPQCPALSVPSGSSADGLPTAVQIVARRFDDPMALRIGAAIEARMN